MSFNHVMSVLKSNPYDPAHLPVSVTSLDDIRGEQLLRDAGRTLDSPVDIRSPFRRLLHPNGICLSGEWIIDRTNPYSGLFKAGTRFPIIVRLSPPNEGVKTRKLHPQSIGFVGKIFPSTNRVEEVRTANFFTQTDLGGFISSKPKILDSSVVMSNAPGVTAVNRGPGVVAFAVQGDVLNQVDMMNSQRQLYPLAEANKKGEATQAPRFMKLSLNPSLDAVDEGGGEDMRLEVWNHLAKKEPLIYDITVSNDGQVAGPAFLERSIVHWDSSPIGRIEFNQAVLSAACDDQIHFCHPPWRLNVNDPNSSVRLQHGVPFGEPLVRDQVIVRGEVASHKPVGAIFTDLNQLQHWPEWRSNGLLRDVRPTGKEGFYEVTFAVGGDLIRSLCRHEAEADSVVSLSCRGTDNDAIFLQRPTEHRLTFLLSQGAGGISKIDWQLLMKSRNAMDRKAEIEASLQKTISEHFQSP